MLTDDNETMKRINALKAKYSFIEMNDKEEHRIELHFYIKPLMQVQIRILTNLCAFDTITYYNGTKDCGVTLDFPGFTLPIIGDIERFLKS